MKRQVLNFKFELPKTRAHRVLFENNTPYKPKVVESKITYKRKPKHRNKQGVFD